MRWFLLIAAIAAVALSGCRKKSSPEFYDAQTEYTGLVDRLGDDAYTDDEMDHVKQLLGVVPPDALEAGDAKKLLAEIESNTNRVLAAQGATAKPGPSVPGEAPPLPPDTPAAGTAVGSAAGAQADGGSQVRPHAGMTEDEFKQLFGDCVASAGEASMPGISDKGAAWAVNDDDACRQKLGAAPGTSYVFVKGTLRGMMQRSLTETREAVDAGPPPPKPPAPPPTIPGFPEPGADKTPPPPAEIKLPTE